MVRLFWGPRLKATHVRVWNNEACQLNLVTAKLAKLAARLSDPKTSLLQRLETRGHTIGRRSPFVPASR